MVPRTPPLIVETRGSGCVSNSLDKGVFVLNHKTETTDIVDFSPEAHTLLALESFVRPFQPALESLTLSGYRLCTVTIAMDSIARQGKFITCPHCREGYIARIETLEHEYDDEHGACVSTRDLVGTIRITPCSTCDGLGYIQSVRVNQVRSK
jgi:hypothetical protein